MTEIRVPAAGESVTEADIGQWLVKVGDRVKADQPIVSLETDKAAMDVPAPADGVITAINAKEGDTVSVGDVIAEMEEGGQAAGKAPTAKASNEPASGGIERDPAPAETEEEGAKAALAAVTDDSAQDAVEITAPSSGESVTEADIGSWLVKVGQFVKQDDPVVSLETDKAAVDVPAPISGVLTEIRANEGDTVAVGDVLGLIVPGEAGKEAAPSSAAAPKAEAKPAAQAPVSPAPRRVIEQNGLDAGSIAGTGKGGRITKGDALAAASRPAQSAKPQASAAPRPLGEREERVKMSRLRQTIARRLKESQDVAAQLTTFNDVDMTAVMEARSQYKELFEKKHGVKLGFMSFFVKACVQALREVPEVNAEIDGADIIYKNHYDIGIAVGTEKGLVVPVLKDADMKSLAQIEKDINDFGRRARSGDLKLEEMQGGTFTITNGGVYGSLMSTPILNMPQSGILGMHRIEQRPVAVKGEIKLRPMMYLALSYDHRIVDGKGAVTFLVRVKENLEDPQRLLLDL
ncbi:2-oxoglutarate dehydrogenase complex dihydrolipoyllysine-residue succinyltransferase [Parvularcula dongshanensis]|uniref:Dihydrolipoyllysine-residue succinyltransferase component of 2-oxoglutarate dehydrogenase complex n=1 Tax=Parvularcula dongshanensis TaxID=1173995 RepID=A0A840I347_9PROT|nr:2-oxoglutarate dehydrogenase complex dihydrolipoyllysine-residue succinyltransferase [Parvularcula dongshanensis]MBB4659269.1 2-oxoglutarate dehydrogenase E2 component (dihydrolipoamide succinyltransferase) [Parvularcula dongshanensis]